MANRVLYEFGEFQVDPEERALTSRGTLIPLPPKAFDALLILVQHAGSIVAKDDLQAELWPSVFVEENNLAQLISVLRKRLGDRRAAPVYIQTIAKRGYRFYCPVRRTEIHRLEAAPVPALVEDIPPAPAIRTMRAGLRRGLWAGAAAVGLAITLAAAHARLSPIVSAATPATIAVLPFKMPPSEPPDSFTGLALADDAIRRFGMDGGLRVLPVSAVMTGTPEHERPTETARRLGVAFVVTTQVTPLADGIEVRSRLVRQADGSYGLERDAAWQTLRTVGART